MSKRILNTARYEVYYLLFVLSIMFVLSNMVKHLDRYATNYGNRLLQRELDN